MNFLAFDLGGSSGKLSLASVENGIIHLEKVHAFANRPIASDGHLCWDLPAIYEELLQGIKKAVDLTGDRIDGIAFDSFCNDFVLLSKDGELLAPVYCYRDERTLRWKEHTYGIMAPEALYRINGNQIALFNTLLQLDAMRQEGMGELLDQADRLLFISDYFIRKLTDISVTEYTTASVTQMYDYAKDNWSEEILYGFGIRKNLFAPIVNPGTIVGKTTDRFCEVIGTRGFQVATVCQHDTASAFLASVGTGDYAIISTGTWCLVGVEAERPLITPEGFAVNLANEGGYPGHHRLLRNVMGTWILQEVIREEKENGRTYTFEELDRLAECKREKTIVKDRVWFDVDHEAFYYPGDMVRKVKEACHKTCGNEPEDIGELVCVIYFSLALKYRYTIEQLEQLTGRNLSVINMIGGGSKSRLMCQITADVCQRELIAGPADATTCGNVLVQMLAHGLIRSVEEGRQMIRNSIPVRTYLPEQKPAGDF